MSENGSGGIRSIRLGRTSFALVGVLWAVRSLHSFTEPNFADPESVSDWLAVVTVSLALAALPAGMWCRGRAGAPGA